MKKNLVAIVMGSGSDRPIMEEAEKVLKNFNIPFEVKVTSAHRTPEQTMEYAKTLEERGIRVAIAGAGAAAHLAGAVAAWTTLPVIGVPIDSSPLKGLDSLLSTVQMPGGIPVASMAIGKAGAKNAALFAAAILALSDPEINKKLKEYRDEMKKAV
ncbi:MAG: 5-(carboxyamino)imidazole ribonucleotide mutase [Nitrospinae bacterium]|nr:5-(carboxyamino)imidazole ribonucleotide mutase [Nitrospinota bacterium]